MRVVVQVGLLGLVLACVTPAPTNTKGDWDIYSFHVNSTVTSRYATTVIVSRVANRISQPQEIEFDVKIPKNAFISKFRMTIEGQTYDGVVKQKEEAQQQYTKAVSRGQSAGIISSVGRTLEVFKTSVTVAGLSKVTFELTYEELLKRRLGKYELLIHARPMQPVSDFKIDVYINEKPGINFLEVKGDLTTRALANAITKTHANNQAWVHFYPTAEQQTQCVSCGAQGLNGDLVVVYDVNRGRSMGDLKESEGYFVHYFAPNDLPRIPKNVVFIIDRSGSMHGRKIQQTRAALLKILGDLAEDDHFGLITFDSDVSPWRKELLQANEENLAAAKTFANNIQDRGATDINAAVLKGAEMLNRHPREGSASLLILLTDGDPTSGETNMGKIQKHIKEAISKKFPLYCLGFGMDVNFEFLEKMALENSGVARRIYEDSDAALQLKGFYEEVATPLLTDVQMIYIGGANLTQTNFSQYYNGSELVVAGQITDNNMETFSAQVIGISKSNKVEFSDTIVDGAEEPSEASGDSHIQRLWAYLTVKQLLDREVQLTGDEKEKVKKETLELSLKYSFVTPLTSMVVTKPQGEDTQVAHKPKEGEKPERRLYGMHGPTWTSMQSGVAYSPAVAGHMQPGVPVGQAGSPDMMMMFSAHADYSDYGGVVANTKTPVIASRGHRPLSSGRVGAGGGARGGGRTWIPVAVAGVDYEKEVDDVVIAGTSLMKTHLPDITQRKTTLQLIPSQSFPAVPEATTTTTTTSTRTTTTTTAPTASPVLRFLLAAKGQVFPLCYDVPMALSLRLLQDPSTELSMNGELGSSANEGFQRIVIHYKDQHIEFDTSGVTFKEGQNVTYFLWKQDLIINRDSVTLILRDMEMDVTIGDTRVVILLYRSNKMKFLWPAIRQRPSGSNVLGLMALSPVTYEEVQGTPSAQLKIQDQEVHVTRDHAVDFSVRTAPTVECWLLPLQSALQGALSDFTVTQL